MKPIQNRSSTGRWLALALVWIAFAVPLTGCDTVVLTSSDIVVDGREVVSNMIKGAIIPPIEELIDKGVNFVFDQFECSDDTCR
jgi:hypothetical protein